MTANVTRARRASVGLVLGVASALVLGSSGALAPDAAYASTSALTRVSGEVTVRHIAGDVVVVREGDVVAVGDVIRTSSGAFAEITYFEGSSVRIEEGSELAVVALATEADGGTVIAMTQFAGRTWHVVTKLIHGSSRYEVRTPTSTATVRGTIFSVDVRVEPAGVAATVTTAEGVVDHSAPDGGAVMVRAGQRSTKTSRADTPDPASIAPAAAVEDAPRRVKRSGHPAHEVSEGDAWADGALVRSSEPQTEVNDDGSRAHEGRTHVREERQREEVVTSRRHGASGSDVDRGRAEAAMPPGSRIDLDRSAKSPERRGGNEVARAR